MLTISSTFIGDPLLNNVDHSREWVLPRLLRQVQNGNPWVIWISEKAEMSNVSGDRTVFFLGWLEFPPILWLKTLKRHALCVTATFPQFFLLHSTSSSSSSRTDLHSRRTSSLAIFVWTTCIITGDLALLIALDIVCITLLLLFPYALCTPSCLS